MSRLRFRRRTALVRRDADRLHREVHLAQEIGETDHESEHGEREQRSDEPFEPRLDHDFDKKDGDDHAHQERRDRA